MPSVCHPGMLLACTNARVHWVVSLSIKHHHAVTRLPLAIERLPLYCVRRCVYVWLLNCTLADGCTVQCTGIPHWLIRVYILTTTTPKITTQSPFFAPGVCPTLVGIKCFLWRACLKLNIYKNGGSRDHWPQIQITKNDNTQKHCLGASSTVCIGLGGE
jgi:hypothetical protein